jgi:biopolymer transport protein ExbB
MNLLISGGPVLLAILLVSVYAVYLFFERFLKLRKERLDTDALMTRVNAAVRERDLELALAACEQHGGPVARVLRAALLRLPYGRSAVEPAFLEASIQEEQRLTRGLRPLATIAQIAPLMGLLGTVTGMILAFSEISRQGTGNPAALADGIGQALVTTAAGLIVAIPVLIGHAYLSSRVEYILVDIDRRREELMGNVVQAVAARREESGAAAARSDAVRADNARAATERAASDVAPAERADVRPAQPGLNPLRPASDGS